MEELKAKLVEEQTKHGAIAEFIDVLEGNKSTVAARIVALEAQIAASEVTYSIADRFLNTNHDQKYIIAETGDNEVALIRLGSGNRYCSLSIKVADPTLITKAEYVDLTNKNAYCFKRYWDDRKKEEL